MSWPLRPTLPGTPSAFVALLVVLVAGLTSIAGLTYTTSAAPVSMTKSVTASGDDARYTERAAYISSEMIASVGAGNGARGNVNGFRFNGITIPRGARITSVEFTLVKAGTQTSRMIATYGFQAVGNAPAFSSSAHPATRAMTTAGASMDTSVRRVNGQRYVLASATHLAASLQEVINRPDWSSGNSVVLIASGPTAPSGAAQAFRTYDSGAINAPRLKITYEVSAATPTPTATQHVHPTVTHTPQPTATPTNTPTISQDCQELHDSFVAMGPDGKLYPTWHPMKVGDCVFGHDHGNDAGSVVPGFKPLYGYANHVHGMVESHHGFKTYAFRDTITGVDWIITQHQGTTTRNALCGRFHALNVVAFQNGEMQANLSTMADFGQSRLSDTSTPLTPPECPQNAQIVSQGYRRIPMGTQGYTPYLVNQTLPELGLRVRASFLTRDGRTACPDVTCAVLSVNASNSGSQRRFQTLGSESISINVDATTAKNGWFTDSKGVQQYIAPGFSSRIEVSRSERDPEGRNAMWYYNGEAGPMLSATDEYNKGRSSAFNGAPPLMPAAWYVEN